MRGASPLHNDGYWLSVRRIKIAARGGRLLRYGLKVVWSRPAINGAERVFAAFWRDVLKQVAGDDGHVAVKRTATIVRVEIIGRTAGTGRTRQINSCKRYGRAGRGPFFAEYVVN